MPGWRSVVPDRAMTTRSGSVLSPHKPVFEAFDPPPLLGLLPHVPLDPMVRRLEQAIGDEYGKKLRQRMQAAHRGLSEDELDWRFFELKRYFLISALLPETPMFSEAVDEVWHEMLMFTKEYQQFGEQFTGTMLHHAPNSEPVSLPGERAWFDWVYAHLFEPVAASTVLWNGFFRFPMSRERLDFAASAGEAELEAAWFHHRNGETFPEIRATAQLLARQFKEELHRSGRDRQFDEDGWDRQGDGGSLLFLAAGMLFFSSQGPDLFEQGMNGLTENDELERLRNPGSAGACTSCTTGFADYGSNGGGSGGDGGSNGGDGGSSGGGDGGSSNGGDGGNSGGGSSCSSSSCSSGSSCSSSSCSSGSSCGGGSGCGSSS